MADRTDASWCSVTPPPYGSEHMDEGAARADAARLRSFGNRLKDLRKAAGLTQEQLARRAHVDARVIRFVESGSREIGITKLWPLSEGLGVSVEALVRDL